MNWTEDDSARLLAVAVESDAALPEASDLAGDDWRRHTDYDGWGDDDRPGADALADLVRAGHGYVVETYSAVQHAGMCRWCGGPLYVPVGWLCECTMKPVTPATDDGRCKCNWCLINRDGLPPGRGRPRKHCGKPDCRKADQRDRSRRAYARRKAARESHGKTQEVESPALSR